MVLGLLGWACSGGEGGPAEPVVRDSAGVRIVENLDVGWNEANAWRVEAVPSLDLGSADAEAEHQFHMVMGAATLSDGRIVVANAGTQELRWYDASGALLVTAGGEGEGPGEFTGLTSVGVLPEDSVVSYDGRLRRFSVFAPDGEFVRSAPLGGDDRVGMRFPVFMGMLDDGSFIMVGRDVQQDNMSDGPMLAAMPVYVYGSDGAIRDSIGTFHGWEGLVTIRRDAEFVSMAIGDRPFGCTTTVASVGDGIVVGTPHDYAFEIYAPAGTLQSIVRLSRPNTPLTSADIDAYIASQAEDDDDSQSNVVRALRREAAEVDFPDTKPAYASSIRGDAEGNIWVPGYSMTDDEGPTLPLWAVFNRDGRFLGELRLPRRFRALEIGDDYIMGVQRDDLDVEHLQRYAIVKPDHP